MSRSRRNKPRVRLIATPETGEGAWKRRNADYVRPGTGRTARMDEGLYVPACMHHEMQIGSAESVIGPLGGLHEHGECWRYHRWDDHPADWWLWSNADEPRGLKGPMQSRAGIEALKRLEVAVAKHAEGFPGCQAAMILVSVRAVPRVGRHLDKAAFRAAVEDAIAVAIPRNIRRALR